MNDAPSPPDLVLAIVTIETWPPVEKPYPYPRRQSTPPKVQPWLSFRLFLVNRGESGLEVAYRTGGFSSDDDRPVLTSVSEDVVSVDARAAVLVETTDEGAFDFSFAYTVEVSPSGDGATWRGELSVSRWGGAPFDQHEEDPVLRTRARVIRATEWRRIAG